MDKKAFEAAKREISKSLSEFITSSNEESKKLVHDNTVFFMERMQWIDDSIISGKMNDEQAEKVFHLNRNAFEAMASAEKHISKENTKKLLGKIAKKLVEIAVSQGLKALLLAL
ncbi:MAG: hypothetical protein CVU50_01425 [Candidatus Cloacimonetes bacterium HGW-Cloacimonetes-3]|jgi:K+ transporter|nr:MAG: hypothetical protein CVU50_01425 [Candidatus Cloacimonetes bacterium HGW-Cloacimonetes-3]